MYDTIDVHGGSVGVPVWMTEHRWRSLRVIERAILPVEALRELRELLLISVKELWRFRLSSG